MTDRERFPFLAAELHAAFPDRLIVSYDPPQGALLFWLTAPTAQEDATAAGIIAAFDWTPAGDKARLASRTETLLDAMDSDLGLIVQALALVILDETNRLRTRPTGALPTVSPSQLKSAVRARVRSLLGI